MNIVKNAWDSRIGRYARLVGSALVLAGVAHAQGPSSLDGFSTVATGYISTGTSVAIAAAVLGFGWVGYLIVKKFTKGAKST